MLTPWTDDLISALNDLWIKGRSTRQISEEFQSLGYNISRNAVIGKVHRLGLHKVVREAQPKNTPNVVKNVVKKKPQSNSFNPWVRRNPAKTNGHSNEILAMVKSTKPDVAKRILLVETRDNHCRAIVDYVDNKLANAICCGEDKVWVRSSSGHDKLSSYCRHHHALHTMTMGKK